MRRSCGSVGVLFWCVFVWFVFCGLVGVGVCGGVCGWVGGVWVCACVGVGGWWVPSHTDY